MTPTSAMMPDNTMGGGRIMVSAYKLAMHAHRRPCSKGSKTLVSLCCSNHRAMQPKATQATAAGAGLSSAAYQLGRAGWQS